MRITAALSWTEDLDDMYREGARTIARKDMNQDPEDSEDEGQ